MEDKKYSWLIQQTFRNIKSNAWDLFNWLRVSGLRVGQVVDGDGEKDVEQDVVAADEQDDEVDAHDLAPTLIWKGVREGDVSPEILGASSLWHNAWLYKGS